VTQPLTSERILQAAEEVLRRHGPAKANVVDVARALGVSHGSVYRHFPSKQALREAVTRRWLEQFHGELERTTDVESWLRTLHAAKKREALEEPELFATYQVLLEDASGVVDDHVRWLISDLDRIVGDEPTARAILQATTRFHHPAHAAEWRDPEIEQDLERVIELLGPGVSRPR
jgi:AcrR family transcriptional regulator